MTQKTLFQNPERGDFSSAERADQGARPSRIQSDTAQGAQRRDATLAAEKRPRGGFESASQEISLRKLIRQLQLACSGELAAALAYRGHWRSVRDVETRERIRQIEEEERHHRLLVGRMLQQLGKKPRRFRELRASLIGHTLGLLCHVSGRFLPMYGAGKLERRNVKEYEVAAQYALDSGHPEYVDCLLTMAEVEWEHEKYFRGQVEGSSWLSMFPLWPPLPPKEQIRAPQSGQPGQACPGIHTTTAVGRVLTGRTCRD